MSAGTPAGGPASGDAARGQAPDVPAVGTEEADHPVAAHDDAAVVAEQAAHVRVVRGAADEDELAALVAGLIAAHGVHSRPHLVDDRPQASAWSDRRRVVRGPVLPPAGGDAWRWSLQG